MKLQKMRTSCGMMMVMVVVVVVMMLMMVVMKLNAMENKAADDKNIDGRQARCMAPIVTIFH